MGAAVYFGATEKTERHHIGLGMLVVFIFALTVILFKWWRNGDLDPKFKWLLMFAIITVVLACAVTQTYVWVKPIKPITW